MKLKKFCSIAGRHWPCINRQRLTCRPSDHSRSDLARGWVMGHSSSLVIPLVVLSYLVLLMVGVDHPFLLVLLGEGRVTMRFL